MSGRLQETKVYLRGAILSYAYLFFSNSIWLGVLLMSVTFFDVVAGVSGLVAIAVCQICCYLFNFNRTSVADGLYSYNALMVGLALGSYYAWSMQYLAVLVIASMLNLFLTVMLSGRLIKSGLPFLSIPFLITVWLLLLGLFNFSGVKLSVKGVFSLQEWAPGLFQSADRLIGGLAIGDGLHLYLRSLSAILFQYNDLAGIIIAIALLFRSRMTFALSVYGFGIGYGFYRLFEGDFTPLVYSYIGFNFILSAIALGGFFIVPSVKSHLMLLFVIPVTALLLSALHTVFSKLNLPLYSLPFNMIVLLVISALQMRLYPRGLNLVIIQQYSPEANHYKHVYYNKRFAGQAYYHLRLPVMGEWRISQGYGGSITHKDDWQHALDFDIADEAGQTYTDGGYGIRDYYCYDLPVLAPAAGYVTCIKDGIPDNAIGDINLTENWGNTIIIKHAEGLYSKLSHLKTASFKVKEGNYVQAGELVASCGSSGRSPEPHLHFQVQANPAIGSQTIRYPVAYYLVKKGDAYTFHAFDVPQEGNTVRNVMASPVIADAFDLIPGKNMIWQVAEHHSAQEETWSTHVDSYNRKYIYCHSSRAVAYFFNDGVQFYFTDFYGSRNTFLHHFYVGFQKVLLGYYKGVKLYDWLLPQAFFHPLAMAAQDFMAPFFHFMQGKYQFEFTEQNGPSEADLIILKTRSQGKLFNRTISEQESTMRIRRGGIESVMLEWNNRKIVARCVL